MTGVVFQMLYLMLETHYAELAGAIGLIAGRTQAPGLAAPGTYEEFADPASRNPKR